MQVCTSLQTYNHASTSPLSFYRPDAPPSCRTNSVKALKASTGDHSNTYTDTHDSEETWCVGEP